MKFLQQASYLIFNWLLVVVLAFIFFYSRIFTAGANNHPLDCYFAQRGIQCPTCGISRGFSEIMRGHISQACNYNQHSLRLFAFFAIQLILRFLFITLYRRKANIKIIYFDIAQACIIAAFCFYPLFKNLWQSTMLLL